MNKNNEPPIRCDEQIANMLLKKVLEVCRCKSGVPVKEWHVLKYEIEAFIDGKYIEPVKLIRVEECRDIGKKMLRADLEMVKKKLKSTGDLLKVYQQRDMEIKRIVNKGFSGQTLKRELEKQ